MMQLATPLTLDMFVDELVDFAVGLPTADDFAFSLFHESDSEGSAPSTPTATDKPLPLLTMDTPTTSTTTSDDESCSGEVTFAEKTYYMVNTCSSHLACWNATGTGFLVVDAVKFAREVLPDYFKHRNMNSFVCELTLHGFRKTALSNKKSGLECFEFRHPHFVRGKVELLAKIERRAAAATPGKLREQPRNEEELAMDECEEADEVVEAVGDLKFQISELQGEVQQTQKLFDKLLTSLVQQASTPAQQQPHPQQHMMPVQHYMAYPPSNANMYGMAPAPQGMYTGFSSPVAIGMDQMAAINYYTMAANAAAAAEFGMAGAPVENHFVDLFNTHQ